MDRGHKETVSEALYVCEWPRQEKISFHLSSIGTKVLSTMAHGRIRSWCIKKKLTRAMLIHMLHHFDDVSIMPKWVAEVQDNCLITFGIG